jgi:protein SCO1/2
VRIANSAQRSRNACAGLSPVCAPLAMLLLSLICATVAPGPLCAQSESPVPHPSKQDLPPVMQQVDFAPVLNAQIPLNLPFRDESGNTVTLDSYFHRKPVVLALVYYQCPMLCTQVLDATVGALKTLSFNAGQDYDVIAVSFDPREMPAVAAAKRKDAIAEYRRPSTDSGFHFLTGDQSSITAITQAANFHYVWDPTTKFWIHASGIMVLTPEGRISRYFYGTEYPAGDLRLGLVESSQNKIGTPVDKVLLYCYHFNPATGKYDAMIVNIMRLGGLLTLGMLALFVTIFLRRERRSAVALKPGGVH